MTDWGDFMRATSALAECCSPVHTLMIAQVKVLNGGNKHQGESTDVMRLAFVIMGARSGEDLIF